jgi:hypothetical protein
MQKAKIEEEAKSESRSSPGFIKADTERYQPFPFYGISLTFLV